jgi:uncharacterized tellurite resistance protein B-like protein
MLSFFKKKPPAVGTKLEETLRRFLIDVDDDAVQGVLAVAGLLVKVAMEDGVFAADEEAFIRGELGNVGSLGAAGIDAILASMREHAKTIAEVDSVDYAHWLRDKRDREFRLAVLGLLVRVAHAHQGVSAGELDAVGRIAIELGLTGEELAAMLPQ